MAEKTGLCCPFQATLMQPSTRCSCTSKESVPFSVPSPSSCNPLLLATPFPVSSPSPCLPFLLAVPFSVPCPSPCLPLLTLLFPAIIRRAQLPGPSKFAVSAPSASASGGGGSRLPMLLSKEIWRGLEERRDCRQASPEHLIRVTFTHHLKAA